jgi:hypothetical protein
MDYPGTSDVSDLPASPYSLHIPYPASVLRASTVAVDDASASWKACGDEDHKPPSDMGAWHGNQSRLIDSPGRRTNYRR